MRFVTSKFLIKLLFLIFTFAMSVIFAQTITSATYDASTGVLVVTGTGITNVSAGGNDIDASLFTITGEGGTNYTLTDTPDVDPSSATEFTLTLSATDKEQVNRILNINGTTSSGATTYDLTCAANWNEGAGAADNGPNAITVSNVTDPVITSATYDYNSNTFVVTGTNFVVSSGAINDVDLSLFTITGEAGATYTLTTAVDVEITSTISFTFTLSGADIYNVEALLNNDGTTSTPTGTTYNLAAADNWMTGATVGNDISDATSGITVSNYAVPTITSATYDASNGNLVVTGTNLVNKNAASDVDASMFTLTGEGAGGDAYTLTDTPDIEISSSTAFTLVLSATDKEQVNRILNKNSTTSTSGTTYNLAGAEDWMTGSPAANNVVDAAGNGITVSNVAVPTITSATYDYSTNALVVTGAGFLSKAGVTNDVDISLLTFTGEAGATYTLTSATDVEITSTTQFSLTLSGADIYNVEALLNNDGTTSTPSGTTYNLAAAEDWAVGADAAVNVADLTLNGVTVSNYAVPTVTSATYDYNTNTLVVTGTNFVNKNGGANDVDVSLLTVSGEGGSTYTLTSATDVEITSATTYSVVLSGTDLTNVEALLNKDGTTAATGGQTFILGSLEDWMTGSPAANNVVDAAATITVSNYVNPVITSATYDYNTNVLVATGTNFVSNSGSNNDVDISLLTFTGEAGATYTIASVTDVEITSATQFSVTLTGADIYNVEALLNNDGTTSTPTGTTYNLAAADNWMAVSPAALDISDATSGITVSNYAVPTITSATYDASNGNLVVTGTNLVNKNAASDVDASLFTLTGEGAGGDAYTLTDTPDIEISSSTAFTLVLSATDKEQVNRILNKNSTTSTSGTTYNLAGAEDWMTGSPAANNVVDAAGNGITVSNVAVPTITSATYDYSTNALVVTGAGFLSKAGVTNDIDISLLTFTGEAGATYTLTSATDVEITSTTQFSLTLSGADIYNVEALLNKDGTSSDNSTTYNLAAAEDWAVGADAAVNVVDAAGNGITVSNYAIPTITSATYDWSNGQLAITGTNFVNKSGVTNDVDAPMFTITGGESGSTYTLTDTPDIEITSSTLATFTLSATDKLNIHGLLNKNGVTSGGGTTYNLAGADNWMVGSPVGNNIADLTGNAITVSNVAIPTITSATYDSDTGILVVTGTNLFKKPGATNDVDISTLTFTGEGGTYTITSATDVEITSATQFSVTLTGADKTGTDTKLDQLGTSSSGGTTYNLAAAEDWLTGADPAANIADLAGNGITVTVNPNITSATYNATTGVLVVTGTNIQANGGGSDIDASLFTFTGEGGSTYTLTNTADVNRDAVTQFTLTLSATDKAAVNQIINKIGATSTGGTTYNLAAADDWCTNVTAGNTEDLTGNGITASAVPAPTITSATYNAGTGALVVTGTGLLKLSGATNDIVASKFTFTGEGGGTYTLTTTPNVEITSSTAFTLTLSSVDKEQVNTIVNKNGTASTSATTYILSGLEDWAAGADAAVNVADLAGNGITASNVPVPAITSATYNSTSGTLVVTGTGFSSKSGVTNDIDASAFTFTGEAGGTHTLTTTADVEITSSTVFTLVLSGADKTAVNALLNKAGTKSTDNTTYNLAAAEDWILGADAAVNVVDATNAITVSGTNVAPTGADDEISIPEDLKYTFKLEDFTFNDAGGDTFNGIKIETAESKGDLEYNGIDVTAPLTVNDVTKLTFKPDSNKVGSPYTTFEFKVIDSQNTLSVNNYKMTINVTSLNDAPVIVNSVGATINEGATFIFTSDNLSATDTESNDDSLKFVITKAPVNGKIVLNETETNIFIQKDILEGKVKYIHNGSETTTDTLKFIVKDSLNLESTESIITFTILNQNDSPEFSNIPEITFNEDKIKFFAFSTINSWIIDPDTPDSNITVLLTSQEKNIIITTTNHGYALTASENWFGEGKIKLAASDGENSIDSLLTVKVNSVNDLPDITGLPATITFANGEQSIVNLNSKISDVETVDSLLIINFEATPDSLVITYDKNTFSLAISAKGNFNGAVEVSVSVKDTDGGESNGTFNVVVEENVTGINRLEGIPTEYTLSQNYPNPFNPSTKFKYGLPSESNITIKIFDIIGNEVSSEEMTLTAGYYEYKWDAQNLASGIYFYILVAESETGIFKEVRKMMLVK